jgi:hypothetical protein
MTTNAVLGQPEVASDASADHHLRAGAQLVGTSITAGTLALLGAWLLGLAVPALLFAFPGVFYVLFLLPPAAAAGGVGGVAALVVCRAIGVDRRAERFVVPISGALLSIPPLLALRAVLGATTLGDWWPWVPAAALAAAFAHWRLLRHPLDDWRPVLVRLLFGLGLALGSLGLLLLLSAGFWSGILGTGQVRGLPAYVAVLGVAGVLGLAALCVSLGPFRNRTMAALTWSGMALLSASIVAVILGVVVQSARYEPEPPAARPPAVEPAPGSSDPDVGTGFPGEEPRVEAPTPSLEEGRAQFASLAAATVEAAGPDATWRDDSAAAVREVDCGDGRTMLRIDAEFAMGVVTDTTTDEQDRAVTEANLAAADRIVVAWAEAGLGTPEVMHGEPILGGAAMGAVEFAKVDFAFGVAQPRIEGRCLPAL